MREEETDREGLREEGRKECVTYRTENTAKRVRNLADRERGGEKRGL